MQSSIQGSVHCPTAVGTIQNIGYIHLLAEIAQTLHLRCFMPEVSPRPGMALHKGGKHCLGSK